MINRKSIILLLSFFVGHATANYCIPIPLKVDVTRESPSVFTPNHELDELHNDLQTLKEKYKKQSDVYQDGVMDGKEDIEAFKILTSIQKEVDEKQSQYNQKKKEYRAEVILKTKSTAKKGNNGIKGAFMGANNIISDHMNKQSSVVSYNNNELITNKTRQYDCNKKSKEPHQLFRAGDRVAVPTGIGEFMACLGDCLNSEKWVSYLDETPDKEFIFSCDEAICTLSASYVKKIPNINNLSTDANNLLNDSLFRKAFTHTGNKTYNKVRDSKLAELSNPNLCSQMLMNVGNSSSPTITCQEAKTDSNGNLLFDDNGEVVYTTVTKSVLSSSDDNVCKTETVCTSTELRFVEQTNQCLTDNPISSSLTSINSAKGFCGSTFPKDSYVCTSTKTATSRRCDVSRQTIKINTKAVILWKLSDYVSCGKGTIDGDVWLNEAYTHRSTDKSIVEGARNLSRQTCKNGRTESLGNSWGGGNYLSVYVIPNEEDWINNKVRLRLTGYQKGGKQYDYQKMQSIFVVIYLSSTSSGIISGGSISGSIGTPNEVILGRTYVNNVHIADMGWSGSYKKKYFLGSPAPGLSYGNYKVYYTGSCSEKKNYNEELINGQAYHYGQSECSVKIKVDRIGQKLRTITAGIIKHKSNCSGREGCSYTYSCPSGYSMLYDNDKKICSKSYFYHYVANYSSYSTGLFKSPHSIVKQEYTLVKDSLMEQAELLK